MYERERGGGGGRGIGRNGETEERKDKVFRLDASLQMFHIFLTGNTFRAESSSEFRLNFSLIRCLWSAPPLLRHPWSHGGVSPTFNPGIYPPNRAARAAETDLHFMAVELSKKMCNQCEFQPPFVQDKLNFQYLVVNRTSLCVYDPEK